MRGQILGVDRRTGEGQLAGEDGRRYRFRPDDWAHRGEPAIGLAVDFEPEENAARSIFPVPAAQSALAVAATDPASVPASRTRVGRRSDRNRLLAALLAFFLGPLGLHRFYLGRNGTGVVMLILSITVIGLAVTVPWSLIDFVRYLAMSNREFDRRYGEDA